MDVTKPIVLLTAFGPFPGVAVNRSSLLVADLATAATDRFPNADFLHFILPTEWAAAPNAMCELVARHRPAVVLMLGVSASATLLTLESGASNICGEALDVTGCRSHADVIDPSGPERIQATWPIDAITERLTTRRIAWRISEDAGRYICNASLYQVLASAASGWGVAPLTGFVHIPRDLGQLDAGPGIISQAAALHGCLEIIDVCLQTAARAVNSQPALTVPPV